jgi:hypothetical protein
VKCDRVKTDVRPDRETVAADAALLARIAALSPPAMPPALRERIVRDVPRLAQLPAPADNAWPERTPPALLRVMARPDAPAVPRRRRGVVAGFASLAAGIAAIALIGPQTAPPGSAAPTHRVAAMAVAPAVAVPPPVAMAPARVPAAAPRLAAPAAVPAAGSANVGPDNSAPGNGAEMTGTEMAAAPAPQLSGPPAPQQSGDVALAPAIPARRAVYGPVDTEAPSAAFAAHGPAGSAQSFGYGLVGGDSGAARGTASARAFGPP